MQFETLADFFNMGGYALYVWLAYGSCFGGFIGLYFYSRQQHKSVLAQLAKRYKREHRLKQQAKQQSQQQTIEATEEKVS